MKTTDADSNIVYTVNLFLKNEVKCIISKFKCYTYLSCVLQMREICK